MNVTEHSLIRYCQRVIGIKSEQECKDYIYDNRHALEKDILDMYEKSTWFYYGRIGEGSTKNNYSAYEDYLLIADKDNENAVTLYRIEFPFPRATNIKVIKDLVKEIKKKQAKLEKAVVKASEQIEKKQAKHDALEKKSTELRKQLQVIGQEQKELKLSMNRARGKTEAMEKEIKELAYQLCYGGLASQQKNWQKRSG